MGRPLAMLLGVGETSTRMLESAGGPLNSPTRVAPGVGPLHLPGPRALGTAGTWGLGAKLIRSRSKEYCSVGLQPWKLSQLPALTWGLAALREAASGSCTPALGIGEGARSAAGRPWALVGKEPLSGARS